MLLDILKECDEIRIAFWKEHFGGNCGDHVGIGRQESGRPAGMW